MLLEICASSLQSAINAQEGGAQRIELCCNLEQGGLTPSAALIKSVRRFLDIEIFVLIRPRIGGFNYAQMEFEQMQDNILFCLEEGIDGVVFGVLDDQNEIDQFRNSILAELAESMDITFHRAFDCIKDPFEGMEILIDLGFDRILTSGLKATAIEGQLLIKKLIETAKKDIMILPGSGLNSQNIADFVSFTNTKEVHASAKKTIIPLTKNLFSAPYFETDIKEVQRLNAILQQFT